MPDLPVTEYRMRKIGVMRPLDVEPPNGCRTGKLLSPIVIALLPIAIPRGAIDSPGTSPQATGHCTNHGNDFHEMFLALTGNFRSDRSSGPQDVETRCSLQTGTQGNVQETLAVRQGELAIALGNINKALQLGSATKRIVRMGFETPQCLGEQTGLGPSRRW